VCTAACCDTQPPGQPSLFGGWAYRFEAYTPASKRVRDYSALPMLWRGQVIRWANVSEREGYLRVEPGYVSGRAPRDPVFRLALEAEQAHLGRGLGT